MNLTSYHASFDFQIPAQHSYLCTVINIKDTYQTNLFNFFSSTAIICVPEQTAPEGGSVDCKTNTFGTVCTFTCDDGAMLLGL